MGAVVCQSIDPNLRKIIELKTNFSIYNKDQERETGRSKKRNKRDISSLFKGLEIKLWEHYKMFFKFKNELERTNNELYTSLFVNDLESSEIEVKNVFSDDEHKFLFFFNKREFMSVTMSNCHIIFPRFCMQYFPKFENEDSQLKRIVINDSTITFEKETSDHYEHLENLEYLDLSFNNIEELSEQFKKFNSLKTLLLKRNSLSFLPNSIGDMENLTELNLTDNRLTRVPHLNFSKLVKLNLNMNHLSSFECVSHVNNPPLEYLFLANNELVEIPKDILKFKKLKHVALDSNKLKEISDWVKNEIEIKLSISLSNNNSIKNKEMFSNDETDKKPKDVLINDILSVNANDTDHAKNINKNNSQNDIINNNNASSVSNKAESWKVQTNQNEADDDGYVNKEDVEVEKIIKGNEIKNIKHVLEFSIKKKVDEMMDKEKGKNKNTQKDVFKNLLYNKKQEIVCEELKRMIESKQESEIAKFGDFELKNIIKVCYGYLNKYNEYEITGQLPKDVNEDEMFIFLYIFKITKQKYDELRNEECRPNKNDLNNLVFLNHLGSTLVHSKVIIFLKYLANIDTKLAQYFHDLIDEYDINSFIMLVTELKLFLKDIIEFYDPISDDMMEVSYEYKITQNVIHKIFKENITTRILYRIGLKGFRNKRDVEIAEFMIDHSVYEKHRLLESFVKRVIKVIKGNNMKILTLY